MNNVQHILVPVDFSETSKPTFEYANFSARRFGAKPDVLHVWVRPSTRATKWWC